MPEYFPEVINHEEFSDDRFKKEPIVTSVSELEANAEIFDNFMVVAGKVFKASEKNREETTTEMD